MKKTLANLFILTTLTLTSVACKSDKKNNTEIKAPQEVVEKSDLSETFKINTEESAINWTGSKPTGEHIGSISIASGSFHFTNHQLESGKAVIDMTSITVEDEGMPEDAKKSLEAHLKGTAEGKEEDFFNTKKFPTAGFEITRIQKEGEKMLIQGNLTMKEKTQNVSFPAAITWASDSSSVKIISEAFTIDRTKWDVNYGSKTIFGDLGDKFINDEISLKIAIKAYK